MTCSMIDHMPKIAVALTCFNRREKTLRCLNSLFSQDIAHQAEMSVFLLDDGSMDGTSRAVASRYPRVRLLCGNGRLYWNGGMYLALKKALEHNFHFHLWLNDDVELYPHGVSLLLETHQQVLEETGKDALIVGAFRDPDTGTGTYGGQCRISSWHPFRFQTVFPVQGRRRCHTFHGNGVLVPASVFRKIGIIESRFSGCQNIGDTEYGLRAAKAGIPLWTSNDFIGQCPRNPEGKIWRDAGVSFRQRWALFWGPKGIQLKNYLILARRHGGAAWMAFGFTPFIKALPGLFFPCLFPDKR